MLVEHLFWKQGFEYKCIFIVFETVEAYKPVNFILDLFIGNHVYFTMNCQMYSMFILRNRTRNMFWLLRRKYNGFNPFCSVAVRFLFHLSCSYTFYAYIFNLQPLRKCIQKIRIAKQYKIVSLLDVYVVDVCFCARLCFAFIFIIWRTSEEELMIELKWARMSIVILREWMDGRTENKSVEISLSIQTVH